MDSSAAISGSTRANFAISLMMGKKGTSFASPIILDVTDSTSNPAPSNISKMVFLVNHRKWVLSSKPESWYRKSPIAKLATRLQFCALGIQATTEPWFGMTVRIFFNTSQGSTKCSSASAKTQQSRSLWLSKKNPLASQYSQPLSHRKILQPFAHSLRLYLAQYSGNPR